MKKVLAIVVGLAIATTLASCGGGQSIVASDACWIDVPVPNTTAKLGEVLAVGGWAFDKAKGEAPKEVTVQILSADQLTVKKVQAKRGDRVDVVSALHVDGALHSGFTASVETKDLRPGKYELQVLQSDTTKTIVCTVVRPLELTAN